MSEQGKADEGTPGALGWMRRGWRAVRQRWWSRWAMDIGVALAILWAITAYQTRQLVDSGQRLPEFTLQTVEGESMQLVDPDSDRTLVYAWATWCGVCTAQTGTVQWAKPLLGDDVSVRAVVFDYRSVEHARRSGKKKGMTSPILLGTERLRQTLKIGAYPTFYVVNKEGRVLAQTQGYTTTLGLWWRGG